MPTDLSSPQIFYGLAERVKHLFCEFGVVKNVGIDERTRRNKYFFEVDRLYYDGFEGVKEYVTILANFLAALKTQNKIQDFDTLMLINNIMFSPLSAGIFPLVILEHNSINPQRPIKHALVYSDWLEAPTPRIKFHGFNDQVPYQGILLLDHGEYSFPSAVSRAIIDLKRPELVTKLAYSEHKPNFRGLLQVIDHEDGFGEYVQEKTRSRWLGYPMSYHRILPVTAFNGAVRKD